MGAVGWLWGRYLEAQETAEARLSVCYLPVIFAHSAVRRALSELEEVVV